MQQLTQKEILKLLKSYKLQYACEERERVELFSSYAKGTQSQYSDVAGAYNIDKKKFSLKHKNGFNKIRRIQEVQETLTKILRDKVDRISLISNNWSFSKHINNEMMYV